MRFNDNIYFIIISYCVIILARALISSFSILPGVIILHSLLSSESLVTNYSERLSLAHVKVVCNTRTGHSLLWRHEPHLAAWPPRRCLGWVGPGLRTGWGWSGEWWTTSYFLLLTTTIQPLTFTLYGGREYLISKCKDISSDYINSFYKLPTDITSLT